MTLPRPSRRRSAIAVLACMAVGSSRPAGAAGSAASPSLVAHPQALAEDALGPFPEGALVALRGTPHLWVADERGVLHWGGDTRALAGRPVRGDRRAEASLDRLWTLPRGEPWLSAGLLKLGDPIYLPKWETGEARPTLYHVQDIRDVELFGIDAASYGALVLTRDQWATRYAFAPEALSRQTLLPVVDPAVDAAAGAATAPARWSELSSAAGGFALFVPPGAMPVSLEAIFVRTADGLIALDGTGALVLGPPAVPAVPPLLYGCTAYAGALRPETPAATAAEREAVLASIVAGLRGPLLAAREVQLGRHSGRELVTHTPTPSDSLNRHRVYLVGRRVFLLTVLYPYEAGEWPDGVRVLDSFRLFA